MEVVGAKAEKKASEEDKAKSLGIVLLQLSQCHICSCSYNERSRLTLTYVMF